MEKRSDPKSDEAKPLDPVALTIAVWLGVIVCTTALVRLFEQAAADARLNPAAGLQADMPAFSVPVMGYGG